MLCAHIRPKTKEEQSVIEHLMNVSILAKSYGSKISLEATGELIGILHDMGKETEEFNAYIHYSNDHPEDKSLRGSINHSTAGAKFIYDNFYNSTDLYQVIAAQLIALDICSHHGGLIDCLDLKGTDEFTNRMNPDKEIFYDEALSNFKKDYLGKEEIGSLFNKSKEEVKAIMVEISKLSKLSGLPKGAKFLRGMLVKYLFSCLIDADRYDTYTFMEGIEWKDAIDKAKLWGGLLNTLESKLNNYPKDSKIDLLRKEISESCRLFAENKPGVYQLSVPTGGGKTLSSLRYALAHAQRFKKDRILYIIPFTTIIDQNAKEIKDILGREDIILEHHSNLLVDNEQEDYKLLTERWDSPIIFTTMVQFLDTLFRGGTQSVRRLHNLANSVIVFDEIQALPIKCINMFNSAINFLSNICKATVILCTATQPLLSKTEFPLMLSENANIISNTREKFEQFKRVSLIDKTIDGAYSVSRLKDFIIDKMDQVNSLLIILNTKNSAKEVFEKLKAENDILPNDKKYYIFHLSTNMCAAHRISVLDDIKDKLGKERVICVSTQLIEAGVNISFECVVRSLAGLDSIAQAAGRCNRHGKCSCKEAYIVKIEDENISKLIDIKKGQECTIRVLSEFKNNPEMFDNDLLSQKAMDMYYQYYFHNRSKEMNYTLKNGDNDKNMYDLLSSNKEGINAYNGRNKSKLSLLLRQAFKTSGDNFNVIDQVTTSVIVPYKEGKNIILRINGERSLSDLKNDLKRAQQYSVNLFDTDKKKLEDMRCIVELKNGGVLALKEGFYTDELGIVFEQQQMEFKNY